MTKTTVSQAQAAFDAGYAACHATYEATLAASGDAWAATVLKARTQNDLGMSLSLAKLAASGWVLTQKSTDALERTVLTWLVDKRMVVVTTGDVINSKMAEINTSLHSAVEAAAKLAKV
ncbi:hypothetical protein UFOVP1519_19 [uncultured Caudovirales phage]|uniref:Uncharacterized protein n=1 Tax=uncultured Caudovirales phage TaxID=2100421 RepID=A0A6J7X8T8_9CAUD|nr:hypothetical protein UFOVP1306_45 [uncultured Caudovirales phage]CAB4210414.1 hypothetical protein UFOVP1422_47 [uncultured Caudovirales phage]CAB5227210.1 hypothetical protein UFOVP1519_19 [uncultured Caudovirales phage]